MGEIKSALELAMERSKKYVVSDEEREEIREKEMMQKATALFHRYTGSHLSLHEMIREIEKMDEKTRKRVEDILLSQCVDALSLEVDPERLFSALESLEHQDLSDMKERFQNLFEGYHEEMEKAKQKMSLELAGALKNEGIYGDAVVPNVEGSDRWKEVLETTGRSWGAKLDEIKEMLRKS
jgi:hypothetical protein